MSNDAFEFKIIEKISHTNLSFAKNFTRLVILSYVCNYTCASLNQTILFKFRPDKVKQSVDRKIYSYSQFTFHHILRRSRLNVFTLSKIVRTFANCLGLELDHTLSGTERILLLPFARSSGSHAWRTLKQWLSFTPPRDTARERAARPPESHSAHNRILTAKSARRVCAKKGIRSTSWCEQQH